MCRTKGVAHDKLANTTQKETTMLTQTLGWILVGAILSCMLQALRNRNLEKVSSVVARQEMIAYFNTIGGTTVVVLGEDLQQDEEDHDRLVKMGQARPRNTLAVKRVAVFRTPRAYFPQQFCDAEITGGPDELALYTRGRKMVPYYSIMVPFVNEAFASAEWQKRHFTVVKYDRPLVERIPLPA